MDLGIGRSLDRISKLPDTLLSHILSYLPTKYAVGTTILSKRWQHLWASVPNLDFDDTLISEDWCDLDQEREDELKLSFTNFVDRVLLLSDVTRLHKFHLVRSWDDNFDLVNTWICTAIKRNAVEIYLNYCVEDVVELPRMLFVSTTLKVLILCNKIMIDAPSSVWLPSLKTLQLLTVKYTSDEVARNLLLGCPILEELYIDRWYLDGRKSLSVSVPTLKYLTIRCLHNVLQIEDEFEEPGHKLVIDAPRLKNLDLIDYISDDFTVVDLSSLVEANIHVGLVNRMPISGSYGGHVLKLLSGIANVKSLCLSDSILSFLASVNSYVIPTFHNLTRMKLEVGCRSGWKLLIDFLECSPRLEVLAIENVDKGHRVLHQGMCWNPPQRVPNCLLLHLKEVDITECNGEENELEAIKYMLKNGNMLKKMTIGCQHMKGKDEFRVCRKIAGFPRGSKNCPLNLIF